MNNQPGEEIGFFVREFFTIFEFISNKAGQEAYEKSLFKLSIAKKESLNIFFYAF